jgi:hypothetical protein
MSSPSSTARKSRRNFVSIPIVRSGHAWLSRGEKSTPKSRDLFSKITGPAFLCLLLCQPKGREFDIYLGSQTRLHYEFSALLVDARAYTGAKMANTRGKNLSRQGLHRWLTRPTRSFKVNLSPSPSSCARLVNCRPVTIPSAVSRFIIHRRKSLTVIALQGLRSRKFVGVCHQDTHPL